MTTLYFKKDFIATPSLESAKLITSYNRYMKLLSTGVHQVQARAAAGLSDLVRFQKARKAFRTACG